MLPETDMAKRVAELEAENAQLKDQMLTGRLPAEQEKLLAERMASGLSREQALAVINGQKDWEADPRHPKHQQ